MRRFLSYVLVVILLSLLVLPVMPVTAADPLLVPTAEQPKDARILATLTKAGIDKNYVKILTDYGRKQDGKSPYQRIWIDQKSGQKIAEISRLPMVDSAGIKLNTQWYLSGGKHLNISSDKSKNQLFSAEISNGVVKVTLNNDQPNGKKAGDTLTFTPQLYLNNVELARPSPTLLGVDPVNANYTNNTVRWVYPNGITRDLRQIEGKLLGSWTFASNPGSQVHIKYNQVGAFKLTLGQYATDADTEVVPVSVFNNPKTVYPFTIQDTLTVYPNTDGLGVDGIVNHYDVGGLPWATLRAAAGTAHNDTALSGQVFYTDTSAPATSGNFTNIVRAIVTFPTNIGSAANITSATLSAYGQGKSDGLAITPDVNVYGATPASYTALDNADYGQTGSTAFSTVISYASWNTTAYNDFVLNAAGIAAINKTGMTAFSLKNANYDAAGIAPAWTLNQDARLDMWFSEQGAGYEPKLVIVYQASVVPTVTSQAATSIGTTTATANGNVTATGGANVTVQGAEWGTTTGIYTSSVNTTGTWSTGAFTASITGLTGSTNGSTTYYWRPFADNNIGRGYGSELSFATLGTGAVSTVATSNVTMDRDGVIGGTLSGNLTNTGNPTGHVWFYLGLTTAYGTNTTAVAKDTTGMFYALIPTNLTPGQTYHYLATANNTQGSVNGTDQTFTLTMPTVATPVISDVNIIAATSATLNGNMSSLGEASSAYVYFQYGEDTTYGTDTAEQSQNVTGAYTQAIADFPYNSTLHVRAVARVGSVYAYSADQTATVLPRLSTYEGVLPVLYIVPLLAFLGLLLGGGIITFNGVKKIKADSSDGAGMLLVSIGLIFVAVAIIVFSILMNMIDSLTNIG